MTHFAYSKAMVSRLWVVILLILALAFGADLLYPGVQTVTNLFPTATSTLKVVSNHAPRVATSTGVAPGSATTTTSTTKSKASAGSIVAKKTPVLAPSVQVPPPQPTQSEFDATAGVVRSALVNIVCLSGIHSIPSISGSGVIVDPRGIVLTNAHIAQYFLFTGDPSLSVSCTLRAGSPAQNAYRANVMFISPAWVSANADILTKADPTGNGEYDFAFLAITKSATSAALPAAFPFIPLGTSEAYAGEPVVIGSYAAQFLSTSEIQSSLYPTIVFGSVKAIYTFVKTSIDVVTLGGSPAAQEGSSGGGIARSPGIIDGIITTSTTEGDTASRTLGAITTSYIRREYESESGVPLTDLFANAPTEATTMFLPKIVGLRAILTASLSH